MNTIEIVKNLIANGAKMIKNVVIDNVNTTNMGEYQRVSLTLGTKIDGYIADPNDSTKYELGQTNVIFSSAFAIAAQLKDNEDSAFAANYIVSHTKALQQLLSKAKITVIQQHIAAGDEYVNPWSDNAAPTTFDHDVIINHITDIVLGKQGLKALDKISDKLLDEENE